MRVKVSEPTKGSFMILKARPAKGCASSAERAMLRVSVSSPGLKPM